MQNEDTTEPEASRMPPAARVFDNQWTSLTPPEIGRWTPTRPVSVVIPYYQAPEALENTLAALTEQTYPPHLLQVVIADDGSEPPPRVPSSSDALSVEIVRQEHRGFGLSRARNLGAHAADGEILVFIDCDMVPEPQQVEAHARWHHLVCDAVTIGFRRHADFGGISPEAIKEAARTSGYQELLSDRNVSTPEWIEQHMVRTKSFTSGHDDVFRVMSGGNLGIMKAFYFDVGGMDESFNQWGGEDNEFGYRLLTSGALVVPERQAVCWHQGPGDQPNPEEQNSLKEQRAKMVHLIADRTFRRSTPGRSFTVPFAIVTMQVTDDDGEQVMRSVESILGSHFHDLVVVVSHPEDYAERVWLQRQFEGDPRVTVGAGINGESLYPFSGVEVITSPKAIFAPDSIDRMIARLGGRGVGALYVTIPKVHPGDAMIRAHTFRALRRARRVVTKPVEIEATIGELFGEGWASGKEFGIRHCDESSPPTASKSTPDKPIDADAAKRLVDHIKGSAHQLAAAGAIVADGLRRVVRARSPRMLLQAVRSLGAELVRRGTAQARSLAGLLRNR